MRPLTLLALLAVGAGKVLGNACDTPATYQSFSSDRYGTLSPREWDRMKSNIREALDDSPDDLFLNRWLIEWQKRPFTGLLSEGFRKKLEQKPNDLNRQYLYARALTGKDTPSAIEILQKVVARDPKFPWSYLALTEIYSSAAFRDPAKLALNLRAYSKVCRANLDAFAHLNVLQDERDLRELAGQLRTALSKTTDPKQFKYWSNLWAAEFRLTAPGELEKARKTVAEDLRRLEPLVPDSQWSAMPVLSEGYRLSGQPDEEKRINDRMTAARPRDELNDAILAWYKEHPRKAGKDWAKAQYEISGEWVKKWPDRYSAWMERRSALLSLNNRLPEPWSEVTNGIMRSDYNGDDSSRTFFIASDLVGAGVKLSLAELYLKGLLAWAESPALPVSDLIRGTIAADLDERRRPDFQFAILLTLAQAQWMLKEREAEHRTLAKLRVWLDTDFKEHYEQNPMNFPDHEGRYLGMAAALAGAEGHKADALAYYQQLFTNPWYMREYGGSIGDAKQLFKDLGGSEEAWALFSKVQPWPSDRPEPPRGVPMRAWNALNRPLPEMKVPDYSGRIWTLKDFQGKKTFVFLWATWCGPCWNELPGMQKLYDAVKDRPDVQAISLTLDENPAIVERFMKERHFNFPALVDKAYVERVLPEAILGQVWVVDKTGSIRLHRQNAPYNEQIWVDEALDKLNHTP
jgi:peroxiredoxin